MTRRKRSQHLLATSAEHTSSVAKKMGQLHFTRLLLAKRYLLCTDTHRVLRSKLLTQEVNPTLSLAPMLRAEFWSGAWLHCLVRWLSKARYSIHESLVILSPNSFFPKTGSTF